MAEPITEPKAGKPASQLPPETIAFAQRIFEAARSGDDKLVLSAVDAGLPVNLTNEKGNTLLMLAAYAGQTTLAKGLLERGADPNRLNDLGQSIVAGVVFKGHDDIAKALLEKGADPRLGTPSAIQAAYMFERRELIPLLGVKEDDLKDVPKTLADRVSGPPQPQEAEAK